MSRMSLFKRGYPPRWLDDQPEPLQALLRKLRHAYWWVQHRVNPRHRYHVVRTGLKPGYHDIDELMEAVSVVLLRRFVEDTHGGLSNLRRWADELKSDWEDASAKRQGEDYQRIAELYEWFTAERPRRLQELDDDLPWHDYRLEDVGDGYKRLVFDGTEEYYEVYRAAVLQQMSAEEKLRNETTENLKKVIELRHRMWV